MVQQDKEATCCSSQESICCQVEAIVSVDHRGQMVLPKELRARAGINAGDKLAVTSWGKNGKVCCIVLTKAEELRDTVRAALEPLLQDMK